MGKTEPYQNDGGRKMKPRFSLKYGEDFLISDNLKCEKTEGGFCYELE